MQANIHVTAISKDTREWRSVHEVCYGRFSFSWILTSINIYIHCSPTVSTAKFVKYSLVHYCLECFCSWEWETHIFSYLIVFVASKSIDMRLKKISNDLNWISLGPGQSQTTPVSSGRFYVQTQAVCGFAWFRLAWNTEIKIVGNAESNAKHTYSPPHTTHTQQKSESERTVNFTIMRNVERIR